MKRNLFIIIFTLFLTVDLIANEKIVAEGNYWIGANYKLLPYLPDEKSYHFNFTYNKDLFLLSFYYYNSVFTEMIKSGIPYYYPNSRKQIINITEYSVMTGFKIYGDDLDYLFQIGIGSFHSVQKENQKKNIVHEDISVPISIQVLYNYENWLGLGVNGYISLNNSGTYPGVGVSIMFGKLGG